MSADVELTENNEPMWKKEFRDRIQSERIRTDSDVEDFCEEFEDRLPQKGREVWWYLAELRVMNTECEGCAHIEFFGSGMYPCCACRRAKKDMFERASTPKRFVGSNVV